MNTLTYKGYQGRFDYDSEADIFHGEILHLNDVVTFQGRSIDELKQALADSVEEVTGVRPRGVGMSGGTCANFFRLNGLDAYVWQSEGGTLHAPNEYVTVDHLLTDAKVYAALIHRLCVTRRRTASGSSTRCRT